jgi:ATP-binding cassette, subfamily B, bacterial PglK
VFAGLVASALLVSGDRSVGAWLAQLALVGLATYRLLPAIQQLFAAVVQIRSATPVLAAIAPDLGAARRRVGGEPGIDPGWSERPQRAIRLERISFRYAAEREPALVDVSLEIPAGAMVGIVGGNGSGKTTLIDVISGLLRPDSGRLVVDDVVVSPENIRSWQSRVAYVPQQPFLLDASIAENIALGVPPARIDQARLREVLRLTCLSDFVARLPHGIDEPVRERGVALSGGQRQRLVIARALYRGAPVLLMDEPTSSLDGTTEQEVMSMLSGLRGQSTLIMVAHRAHAIRQCDVIFELDAGRLSRSGAWSERGRAGGWPGREAEPSMEAGA